VLPLALRARLWYNYYKFHSIIEQYNQFFTIYLSILQCTNYSHIAIVFPPLPFLDTHNRLFRRPSAAYSVNPGSFSKWRPAKDVKYRRRTRVQISEAFAKNVVTLFCDEFRDCFRHAYKLHTSQRQPSTRTGEFTIAAADNSSLRNSDSRR